MSAWLSRLVSAIRAAGAGTTLWTWLSSSWATLYIWGPILTAWGFIAGWREGIATPYLLASSVFIMGSVAWASLQIAIWRDRNRVKDRLYFRDVTVGVSNTTTNKKVMVSTVQIGILLESSAEFPIDFIVDEMVSDMEGRINSNPNYLTTGGTVLKGRPSYYRDQQIPMGLRFDEISQLTGKIKFKIRYGRNKDFRYPIEHAVKVDLTPDKAKPGHFWVNWSYLSQ
jgi:hypothetical protein